METYIDLLDKFLSSFVMKGQQEVTQHDFMDIVKDYPGRLQFITYLERSGYIMKTPKEPLDYYTITVEGALFHAGGGFKAQYRKEKRDDVWKWVKIVGTAMYSLMALGVAVWAVCADLSR